MKINKANSRDKKRRKKRNGMVVSGKSTFLIQEIIIKRADKVKKKKNRGFATVAETD
jgi:hypothetical protein